MERKNEMNKTELAKSLKHGMFADRQTLEDAVEYAYAVINGMPMEHRIYAFTALHVVLNTVSNEIAKLEE